MTAPRILVAAAVTVAGCAVIDAVTGDGDRTREFNHKVHVEDEGLDCAMCHLGADSEDRPGMPVLTLCQLCHEEPEDPTAPDPYAGPFDDAGQYASTLLTALPGEVVFSHAAHVEADLDCTACHGDVGTSTSFDDSVAVTMAECSACHEERRAPNECATCHSEIDQAWMPPSHLMGWETAHGAESLAHAQGSAGDCSLCHEQQTCTSCHLENPPKDHSNYWRRRGHGVGAVLDRDRCSACHKPDICITCHESTTPLSHTGKWGGQRSTHCVSCHLPAQSEAGCFLCHKGAPSHSLATPLPGDHDPGWNCRACHGVTEDLPHLDNGDSCTACHR